MLQEPLKQFQHLAWRLLGVKPEVRPYHAYTKSFDVELDAGQLDQLIGSAGEEGDPVVDFRDRLRPWTSELRRAAADAASGLRLASRGGWSSRF